MSYTELVKLVEEDKLLTTKLEVIAFLIGYQKKIDAGDFENVIRLYEEGFLDA